MSGPVFHSFDPSVERQCVVFRGSMGKQYVFSCAVMKKFGVAHGMVLKEKLSGRILSVLGELNGCLWGHYVGDKGAAQLKNSKDIETISNYYEPVVRPPGTAVMGPIQCVYYYTTDNLRQQFGVSAGETYHLTFLHKNVSVVGELWGILWVRTELQSTIATPLPGCNSEEVLRNMFGLSLPTSVERPVPIPSPRVGMSAMKRELFTLEPKSMTATCAAPMGQTLHVECGDKAMEVFGVKHGQRIVSVQGTEAGRFATVVGVTQGNLHILYNGDGKVCAIRNCSNHDELAHLFALGDAVTKKATSSEPTSPMKGAVVGSEIDIPLKSKSDLSSFWTAFGRMEFKSSVEACKPFGYFFEQSVRATKGAECGKQLHIVGVRLGNLWVVEEGKMRAVPLSHCTSKADIDERYGFVRAGKKNLDDLSAMQAEPPSTPVHTPRRSYKSDSLSPLRSTPHVAANNTSTPAIPMLNLSYTAVPTSQLDATPDERTSCGASPERQLEGAAAGQESPLSVVLSSTQRPPRPAERTHLSALSSTRQFLKGYALWKLNCTAAATNPMAFHVYFMTHTSLRLSSAFRAQKVLSDTWGTANLQQSSADEILFYLNLRGVELLKNV